MLPRTFIKGLDATRLKLVLGALFLALAIPTGVLIGQAFGQLKWESFYQYRGMAEELTRRIDQGLIAHVNSAEEHGFTDYSFLVVTGDPAANFLQRSPLSAYPVGDGPPGIVGYFQVGSDGAFSTPLLPDGTPPDDVGIPAGEYAEREALARAIEQVLVDNRLVRARPSPGGPLSVEDVPADTALRSPAALAPVRESVAEDKDGAGLPVAAGVAEAEPPRAESNEQYTQQVFDQLNQPARQAAGDASETDRGTVAKSDESAARTNPLGRVQDLRLDDELQKKSESLERRQALEEESSPDDSGRKDAGLRSRRVERTALPAAPAAALSESADAAPAGIAITTFASEIDPYEFSLLDSGHLVLFRKVWRGGKRYIQGLLLDRDKFVAGTVEAAFRGTSLAAMSDLVVAYQDDVIDLVRGAQSRDYGVSASALDGALLFRSRLTAPLDSLELIFSINRLPPGPGAGILGWTTLIIGIVFLGGFLAIYRLGLSQISLARQQQDFVSAVSHELKTPLTSIRMYGEMLKEGWADEEKKQQYYTYIHDESERLTRLISNVLQLARITRNEPQFDMQRRTVGDLMERIETSVAEPIERAGFALSFVHDGNADDAVIEVDDDCFSQIVINLVDNAIKFSKNADEKAIEIGCVPTGDNTVTFTVRDHGPGIPRDQMKKIFRLFYRSESELTRETVGTGIGLAIVHQLTTAMHGRIDVNNRQPGAEFRLSFPRR